MRHWIDYYHPHHLGLNHARPIEGEALGCNRAGPAGTWYCRARPSAASKSPAVLAIRRLQRINTAGLWRPGDIRHRPQVLQCNALHTYKPFTTFLPSVGHGFWRRPLCLSDETRPAMLDWSTSSWIWVVLFNGPHAHGVQAMAAGSPLVQPPASRTRPQLDTTSDYDPSSLLILTAVMTDESPNVSVTQTTYMSCNHNHGGKSTVTKG
ncbi:hypothetical protein SCAR479_06317 [Seiridium cardinale]|uniref:Uncharacterized protein n=1 Tax=Seiridium cardinale TaxID=138064 RepID=A0ABR2XSW9_9PEZI